MQYNTFEDFEKDLENYINKEKILFNEDGEDTLSIFSNKIEYKINYSQTELSCLAIFRVVLAGEHYHRACEIYNGKPNNETLLKIIKGIFDFELEDTVSDLDEEEMLNEGKIIRDNSESD